MSFSVQFEQLMNNGTLYENTEDRPVLDLVDATMECMDILEEITQLEGNLFVYEAVKHVKKAKAGKKKIKTKTTKMKAKDAKAKKAGGKVVKITKEGDTDGQQADGGTGPIPVTSDTNGLTDTDLDADPEAEVQVTEIADGESGEAPAATEAADLVMEGGEQFLVVYEDSSLVTMEAEEKKAEGSFVDAIIKLIKKIGDWISSFISKVISFFKGEHKFFMANKADMNFEVKAKLPTFGGKGPKDACEEIFKSLAEIIGSAKNINPQETLLIDGVNVLEEGASEKLSKKYLDGNAEKSLKEAGIDAGTYDYFLSGFTKKLNDIRSQWRNVEGAFKKLDAKDSMQVKKNITGAHKAVNASFGILMKISRKVLATMRTAAKKAAEPKK